MTAQSKKLSEQKISKEQIDFLRESYSTKTLKEVVDLFNSEYGTCFSKDTVRGIIDRNKIRKQHFVWEKEMDLFLFEHSEKTLSKITEEFNLCFGLDFDCNRILSRLYLLGLRRKQRKLHRHTKEQVDFLLSVSHLNINLILDLYNQKFFTEETKYSLMKVLARNGAKRDRRYNLTEEEKKFIFDNFKKMKIQEFTDCFNREFSRHVKACHIRAVANEMGLKKTTTETKEFCPVGTEVITCGRIKVKTEYPNKWQYKNRLVYEKETGLSANGLNIVHLDGNPLNCNIDNLVAVDLKVLGKANGHKLLKKNNPQLSFSGITLAKLMVLLEEQKSI